MTSATLARSIGTLPRYAFFLALTVGGLAPVRSAAEVAGKVEIVNCGGGLVIPFCYCPPGTLVPLVEPGVPAGNGVPLKDFWISQSEISQEQYKLVMNDQRLERIRKLIDNPNQSTNFDKQFGPKASRFPMMYTTLGETVKFCRQLEKLLGTTSSTHGLVKEVIRIPSRFEWQYACRSDRSDYRHFHGWPENPMDKNIFSNEFNIKVWKALWKKDPALFKGSQDQIIEILMSEAVNTKNPNAEQLLRICFAEALGLTYAFKKTPGALQAIDDKAYKPNGWNIRHMHGNVAEWTLDNGPTDPIDTNGAWALLSKEADKPVGSATATEVQGLNVRICGGGFIDQDWKSWKFFTFWGGRSISFADANKGSNLNEPSGRIKPGIRVVRTRELAENWLQVVRDSAMNKPIAPKDVASLVDDQKTLKEYSTPANQEINKSRLDYYIALANYRLNDPGAAAVSYREFKKVDVKRPQDRLYFQLAGKLLGR